MISYITEPYKPVQIKAVLHPFVNKWFFSKFKAFSPPQLFAVYPIHCRQNVLISSPTGSGKTLTAFLSVLNELIDSAEKQILEDRVYCIYVSPLKALSSDVSVNLLEPLKEMEELVGKEFGIRVGLRTGDTTPYQKQKMLKKPPHILITTPESLAIMINSPKFKEHLTKTQWIIVDEIHSIAENKRGVHMNLTIERMQRISPGLCRVGLSATIAPLEEIARYLVGYNGDDERDCGIVDVQYTKQQDFKVLSPVKSLVEDSYMMKHKKMYELIHKQVQKHKTTLVFTNTRAATERVVHNLKEMYPKFYNVENISAHHGSLSKENRFKTEQDLRDGNLKVVVSSTSLELGIDIGFIDLVLCLGSPKSASRFLQRCLPYNEEVLLDDGSYLPIGQIVEKKLPVNVISFNEKEGFVSRKILKTYKNENQDLLRIETSSGESIKCTSEHPFLTKDGWKEAHRLKEDDQIAEVFSKVHFKSRKIPIYTFLPQDKIFVYGANSYFTKIIDEYCNKYQISLKSFSEKYSFSYNKLIDQRRQNGRKKSILLKDFLKVCKIGERKEKEFISYLSKLKYKGNSWSELPLYLTPELMWVAGLIASDGCIVKTLDKRFNLYNFVVKFSNKNQELVKKYKDVLSTYKIGYHTSIRKKDHQFSIESGNRVFVWLLHALGIPFKNKSFSLKLSPLFFKLDHKLHHGFLEGVFEGDGNYSKKFPQIRIFSCSHEFIKQINRISSRLGYYTTIYTEKSKVSKKIPNIKLKYIYNLTFTRINDIKTFFNEIPCFGPKAKNSKDLVNKFKQHHIKKSKNTKFISWRKIKSIKKITFTEPTYNLTIEGDHNFIVGNIITHNCGRAGHQLHGVVKGRVIVLDRDDLIECSLLLKSAIEKKIDRVQIPRNALDVLAQQIYGIAINGVINIYELFHLIKGSYCYHELTWDDFFELIKFLSGHYVSLEERHVYARIWYDQDTGDIGKKGKLARVIYMTNIGTIPEQTHVKVKIGEQIVGSIDEGFLERMRPGDVFVLGGNVYMFRFARGMTAQVSTSVNRPPTVPSWFSEMLPLSFDLAMEINRFRRLMDERFHAKESKKDIIKFIDDYLYVNEKAAESIYQYFYEQFHFSYIPHDKKIVVESYTDRGRTYVIFQTLFGRRVNDCLSRSLAFVIGRSQHRDVEVGISDNGFYLSAEKTFNPMRAFELLKTQDFRGVLEESIDKSEVLSRRFRHCAGRSLMILRSYMGRKKSVGRAHMGSKILFNAVKRIDPNFSILKEARREVLEDQMDIIHAQQIIDSVINGPAIIVEKNTKMPSPFAFGLIMAGYSDVIKVEDKQEFLKRMHQQVLARIALKHGKKLVKEKMEEFSYQKYWEEAKKESDDKKDMFKEKLKMQVWSLKKVPVYAKEQLIKLIDNGNLNARVTKELKEHKKEIKKEWPQGLREFLLERI